MHDGVRTTPDEHERQSGAAGPRQVAVPPTLAPREDQPVHVGWGRVLHVGLLAEDCAELVAESHDPSTASPTPAAAAARRSAAIPDDAWDFTVPGAQPRASAICASLRSS